MVDTYDAWRSGLPALVPDLRQHPLDYVLQHESPHWAATADEGVVVECGVYGGKSICKIADAMPAGVRVYGFDSFEGLPESWNRPDLRFDKRAFDMNGAMPVVPANVTLVKGWFEHTEPVFVKDVLRPTGAKISMLHVDCDLYSSTQTVFAVLGDHLADDCLIVFDELFNYPTYEKHELLAFHEYLQANPDVSVSWIGKNGPVIMDPAKDAGYWDQPAALRIIRRSR